MKISRITVSRFLHPTSNETETTATEAAAIEIQTDAEITGVAIGPWRASAAINELANTLLLGEDPRSCAGLWQRMQSYCAKHNLSGSYHDALSLLDFALWDIKAKANGEPLWRTLGGSRPDANTHFSDRLAGSDEAQLSARWTAMVRDHGFRSGQIACTGDVLKDQTRLATVVNALQRMTDVPTLLLAAHYHWTPKEAVRVITELEGGFDIAAVEAPCAAWDFLGCKRVSDGVHAAIVNCAALTSTRDFLPFFHERALDIVQGGVLNGGVTGLLQLADAAYGFELPFILASSPGNALAHLTGALPYFQSIEISEPSPTTQAFSSSVVIRDGRAQIGDAPGNGLVLNHAALRAAHLDNRSVS